MNLEAGDVGAISGAKWKIVSAFKKNEWLSQQ